MPGPARPTAAFFDLDRTLLAGFSASAFVRELVRAGRIGLSGMAQGIAAATRFQLGGVNFSGFVAETVGALKGMAESELIDMGERLFTRELAAADYAKLRREFAAAERLHLLES